jgi:predicted restriction endonuclease
MGRGALIGNKNGCGNKGQKRPSMLGKQYALGYIWTNEQKNKLKNRKGTLGKHWILSDKTKENIGNALIGNKHALGYKHTQEDIDKQSKAQMKYVGIDRDNYLDSVEARRSSDYMKWHDAVLERDNYTCFICGNIDRNNKQPHHLNRWRDYPEQRFDIDNGICVCKKHHHILTSTEKKVDKLEGKVSIGGQEEE